MKLRDMRRIPKPTFDGWGWYEGKKGWISRMESGKLHLVDPSTGEKFSRRVYNLAFWRYK